VADSRRDELLASLVSVGPLRFERVILPWVGERLDIIRPSELDRLLDAAERDPEQNLPYWAELWPSGIALAGLVVREADLLRGMRILEIGCGLGITAIAALLAGANLLVSDYAPEALALCALNCLDQTGRAPEAIQANWREPDSAIARSGAFPLVLAADVLYEARDIEPLHELTTHVVAPGGALWLAEPGRAPAARFIDALKERGWTGPSERCAGPWPDPEDNCKGVVVEIHRLRRPVD